MDSGHLWEELHRAMHALSGGGDLRQRLADVYESHLSRLNPKRDLPEAMRADFAAVQEALGREGTALACARGLGDQEARAVARRIISMYSVATRLAARAEAWRDRDAAARRPSAN